jgi:hypothetical protein
MPRQLRFALALLGGFAIAGAPALAYMTAGSVHAAETTAKKKKQAKKKKTVKKVVKVKPDYYGYPQEPNQAGMSDYCSYMYNIYHRRGVGCNQYGHDFMFGD